jgi:hypothetical protein
MSYDYDLDEDDKLTLTLIKEHFVQTLKEQPLTSEQMDTLKNLTEMQKFTKLLHYCMTEESYTKNKYLYYKFLNLCVKCFQKDVLEIMKQMEIEPSDELTKQLQYTTAVYSNILFLKKTLGF